MTPGAVKQSDLDSHNDIIRRITQMLVKSQFYQIRASYDRSPYDAPASYYGYTPAITAHDPKDRFYVIEVSLDDQFDDATRKARCVAFGKHAKLHNAKFWWFVPAGNEEKAKSFAAEWGIADNVQLIKGISTTA